MSKFLSNIVPILLGLALSGCTSAWSTRPTTSRLHDITPVPTRSPATATSQADPQKMQVVMEELRQVETVDPVAYGQLVEELRQSDPSLWPLVMQQFRATAAYRRRAMERAEVTARAERLPPVNDVAPPGEIQQASESVDLSPPVESQPLVVQASYVAPAQDDWQQRLADAIEALEGEILKDPGASDNVAAQARLRMLYAAAGRREDAMRAMPAAPPATQEFLSKEIEGLTAWLNVEPSADAARRAAEAKPALVDALAKLDESVPLLVRNLSFCTEVQSYGCTKRFEKYEFQSNQEVLLYAEVENFASESTAKGYHTSLRSRYQIVDAQGRRMAENTFAATEEHCQNRRRDFFIGYHFRLPKDIGPGKYALQLSIEDLKSRKVGQASVEFVVEEPKEAPTSGNKRAYER